MKLTILGCGTSAGVPRIGNDWGDCDPSEPKNRRSRVSILVESSSTRILVDTSPDLREQFLANDIADIEAIVWTHDHADHCHGIDDIRQVFHRNRRAVPGYARAHDLESLKNRFGYAFAGHQYYPTIIDGRVLEKEMMIGDIHVRHVDQPHGSITSAGLSFEHQGVNICYATDFGAYTDAMEALYQGCDILIVDALRADPHPTHAHVDMTLTMIEKVRPGLAILTHMDKSMDYRSLRESLPEGVVPAYDGMQYNLDSSGNLAKDAV